MTEDREAIRMIVGLGNPGGRYEGTRHNAGFAVVERLARSFSVELSKRRFDAAYGAGPMEGSKVMLVKPQAFMNSSGPPVAGLARWFRIKRREILVVHDDIDLAFGTLKIKEKGGYGGHNGIKSLTAALKGSDFLRLRFGVGRPKADGSVTGHVLGRYCDAEKKHLTGIIKAAEDAVISILLSGAQDAMNKFNGKMLI